jgi:hypothetical protein
MRANLTMNGEARATAGQRAYAGNAQGTRDPGADEEKRYAVLREGREAQAQAGLAARRQVEPEELSELPHQAVHGLPDPQRPERHLRSLAGGGFDQVDEHRPSVAAPVVAPHVLVQVALQPPRGDGS